MNGYTACFDKGRQPSLREFMKRCAKAFGACHSQREDAIGSDVIPRVESEVGTIKLDISEARRELENFRAKSVDDFRRGYDRFLVESKKSTVERVMRNEFMRQRINNVRMQVVQWTPPKELMNLKQFMLKELDEVEQWDCRDSSDDPEREPMTLSEYIEREGEWLSDNLKRLQERLEKRVAYEEEANRWLALLHSELRYPAGVR